MKGKIDNAFLKTFIFEVLRLKAYLVISHAQEMSAHFLSLAPVLSKCNYEIEGPKYLMICRITFEDRLVVKAFLF